MAETTQKTEWQETNRDLAQKEYEEWSERRGRQIAKKPPKGDSIWRYLPPIKGKAATPFKKVWVHYVNNPRNLEELIAVGVCPSKQYGKACPVCPVLSALRRTGNEADAAVADKLRAQEIILANAVRLDIKPDEKPQVEPQHVPVDIFKFLNNLLVDRTENGADFSHPDKGWNIICTRTGEGKNDTKYAARPALKQTPLPASLRPLLGEMIDLDTVFGELDFQATANLMTGGEASTYDKRPAQDVGPATSQRALPPASAPAAEPDMIEHPLTGEWVSNPNKRAK